MMQEQATLMEELREIENVLEINGCFLLRANDNAIIESTIPLKIHNDILWEIAVLRETFQQFATGLQHGLLNDITLEGDRGFIFIYNLPPHFILLAMGPSQINLAYLKIGMIDIIKRIKAKLEKVGEYLLTAPVREFAVVGAEAEKVIPKLVTESRSVVSPHQQSEAFMEARAKAEARAAGIQTKPPTTLKIPEVVASPKLPEVVVSPMGMIAIEPEVLPTEPAPVAPTPVSVAPVEPTRVEQAPVTPTLVEPAPVITPPAEQVPVAPVPVEPAPVIIPPVEQVPVALAPVEPAPVIKPPVEQVPVAPVPVEPAPTSLEPSISITETLSSLKGKSQKERNKILSGVFDQLKMDIKMAKGAEIAATLERIKDAILENFGTSLALFDISTNARSFKNVNTQLTPQQVLMLRDRIANWAQRIIK